jgi:hypothetical protein
MSDEVENPGLTNDTPAPPRRPYSPPAITWEEPLEDRPHLVAACAQRPGQDDTCNAAPRS